MPAARDAVEQAREVSVAATGRFEYRIGRDARNLVTRAVREYHRTLRAQRVDERLELARELKALVHTLGAQGSVIFADGARHEIPCVAPDALLDPTGCGDAYRAGLLYGIARGWRWPSTGRLASVMGAIKIAHRGPQNHKPSREEIAARYRKAFGASPF